MNELLNLVGDMGNHLHGFAQVFTATFFADHRLVNLTGGEVIHLLHTRADKTLVVTQIEISFGTIVGDEYFAVLERAHRSGVNVDIGV